MSDKCEGCEQGLELHDAFHYTADRRYWKPGYYRIICTAKRARPAKEG